MASGVITLTRTGSGELYGQILWSSVSNGTAANTSTVTATIQLKRPAGWYTQGTWKGSLKVGGTTKNISYHTTVRDNWVTIDTLTTTVSHNADGSGSCYIYGILNGPTQTSMEGTSVSGSGTVTLDAIPRFASIVSAPDFHDEENPTITYSNPAGNSVTTLQACISLTGAKADVAYRDISKTGNSYTFQLTEAERNVLRSATTGSNRRTVFFYIHTVIGSSEGYAALSKTFNILNPAPTISPTIMDSNSVTKALTGNSSKLVRYYSNAAVTIGAAAEKQATLVSQNVTCGSKSLTANGTIQGVESGTFQFSATDNRGNTTTKTVTTAFVDYVKLTCELANRMPDASGNLALSVSGNYFNGSFGAKGNSLNVYYRYKPYGGSYGGWTAMSVTLNGHTYTAKTNVSGLDYQTSYVFQCYAADTLATVYSAETVVKAIPVFDWSARDFSFRVPVYDQTGMQLGNSDTQWQNPPMIAGVEYRTAERYSGSVVYRKIVTYTTTTTIGGGSITTISVPHGISNLATPVSCHAKYENYPFLPYIGLNKFASVVGFRTTDIVLSIQNDTWAAGTWYFDLKYTKTMD